MRKNARQPSLAERLVRFLFSAVSVLALAAGEFVLRNPALTGGAAAFLVVLGFVSANALWYQPEAHSSVFFRTRPDLVFKPTPRAVLPGTAATTAKEPAAKPVQQAATAAPTGSASVPPVSAAPDALQMAAKVTDDMLPALSPKADIDVARTQLRLSVLGIYKGPVDGFSGPQTRAALERWHALQQKAAARQPDAATRIAAPDSGQDAVAKVIRIAVPSARPQPQPATAVRDDAPRPKPELASYRKTESAAPAKQPAVADNVSPQDIVRVQAGLKAFGNDQVPVNGRQGKATEAAIRDFQRLFNMPVTGRIDATLIAKMREIGLIG